jgi:hypothetical protein
LTLKVPDFKIIATVPDFLNNILEKVPDFLRYN